MKTKKGILVAVVALVLAAAVSLSAGDEKWIRLKAELNLSDAQVTQLQEKFKQLDPRYQKAMTLKEELKALETAATLDNRAIEAKKADLVALKKEWKAKADAIYKSVLARDQFAKLEEMEAKSQKEHAAKKQ